MHAKQRHTATRIFERLRDQLGFNGDITIVRDYVANAKLGSREVFIPLSHKPGHAQVDFGKAGGIIAGKLTRVRYFCMDLPHSDAPVVKVIPAEVAGSQPPGRRDLSCFHAANRLGPAGGWSGWRESNPHSQLGRLVLYH